MSDFTFNFVPDDDFSFSIPKPVGLKRDLTISEDFREYTKPAIQARLLKLVEEFKQFQDQGIQDPDYSIMKYCLEISLYPGTKNKHVSSTSIEFARLDSIEPGQAGTVEPLMRQAIKSFLSKLDATSEDSSRVAIRAAVFLFSDCVSEKFMSYEPDARQMVEDMQNSTHFIKDISEVEFNPDSGEFEQTITGMSMRSVRIDSEAPFQSWFDRH